jgi:hypothetical protein
VFHMKECVGGCRFKDGDSGLGPQAFARRATLHAQERLNPIGFYENQNGFSGDRAGDLLRLRISLRPRQNL